MDSVGWTVRHIAVGQVVLPRRLLLHNDRARVSFPLVPHPSRHRWMVASQP